MTVPSAPLSSYSVHDIAAVPVSAEVNAGAASDPWAVAVQMETATSPALVVELKTSYCLVQP